mmetsp:Transcript_8751/g.18849  ORF Transcript_8751/g.18849 Transcript_8751/m.18849 type:complete len:248 (-) Transcript_8751:580-1323(-)
MEIHELRAVVPLAAMVGTGVGADRILPIPTDIRRIMLGRGARRTVALPTSIEAVHRARRAASIERKIIPRATEREAIREPLAAVYREVMLGNLGADQTTLPADIIRRIARGQGACRTVARPKTMAEQARPRLVPIRWVGGHCLLYKTLVDRGVRPSVVLENHWGLIHKRGMAVSQMSKEHRGGVILGCEKGAHLKLADTAAGVAPQLVKRRGAWTVIMMTKTTKAAATHEGAGPDPTTQHRVIESGH